MLKSVFRQDLGDEETLFLSMNSSLGWRLEEGDSVVASLVLMGVVFIAFQTFYYFSGCLVVHRRYNA